MINTSSSICGIYSFLDGISVSFVLISFYKCFYFLIALLHRADRDLLELVVQHTHTEHVMTTSYNLQGRVGREGSGHLSE